MADTMRPVSFLPGIKCSDCGVEVEISMLADHICAGTPVAPSAAPDPPPTQEAGLKSMRSFFDRAAELSTSMLKGGRSAPPANIDSKAASEYLSRDRCQTLSSNHPYQTHRFSIPTPWTPNLRPNLRVDYCQGHQDLVQAEPL